MLRVRRPRRPAETRFQLAGTLLARAPRWRRRAARAQRASRCPASSSPTAATPPRASARPTIIYVGEGLNASVAVSRLPNGVLNYHNAGKVQASSEPQDMRLQRMLGHLTTLIPPQPEDGAGHRLRRRRHGRRGLDRSGRRRRRPSPRSSRWCRRSSRNTSASTTSTSSTTRRCTSQIDDARHFLLTTHEKFDAITSDPLDPWVKGAAMLYTGSSSRPSKAHLNPGGVVTLFVQLYESNTAAVKSEIAHLPRGVPERRRLGQHEQRRRATTWCCSARSEPTQIDVDAIQAKLQRSGRCAGGEVACARSA